MTSQLTRKSLRINVSKSIRVYSPENAEYVFVFAYDAPDKTKAYKESTILNIIAE